MRRREHRLLTTLAGKLEAKGKTALGRVVARQVEAGHRCRQRWRAAARFVIAAVVGDRRRIMAGTDCGFETIADNGRVAEDVVWAISRR